MEQAEFLYLRTLCLVVTAELVSGFGINVGQETQGWVMVIAQTLAVSLLSKGDLCGLKAEICHLVVSCGCLAMS